MRIVSGKIYALRIPFVEAFAHTQKNRRFSDSFVVRLTAEDGTEGFGEGAARPYVTGETVRTAIKHINDRLFPAVINQVYPAIRTGIDPLDAFGSIEKSLPAQDPNEKIVWNAARSALELALIDCLLKGQDLSLGAILPPKKKLVTYSGVITAGSLEKTVQHARRAKLLGIRHLKIKIGEAGSVERVWAVRRALGEEVSLRVDANGAYGVERAIEILRLLEPAGIDSAEQPVPPEDDLARVKSNSQIPIMADESLVSFSDAEQLIKLTACDYFNLRISKCGGIINTFRIARLAEEAGIRLQFGCQVGETAILSAAGRHLAAFFEATEFVEGSYGNLLLTEDVSRQSINFGFGGRAQVLRKPGLGIDVHGEILEKYAHCTIDLKQEKTLNA